MPRNAVLAALAACLSACLPALLSVSAEAASSHWATDAATNCAVYDATLHPGDSIAWSGACQDSRADGPGTVTFSNQDGVFESFSGDFSGGMAKDGAVTIRWGQNEGKGWSYDGEILHGRFDGEGILINDKGDQFEGWWQDGKLNGLGNIKRADGERYEGAFANDLPNGHGVLIHADGNRQEGLFQDGAWRGETPAPAAAEEQKDTQTKDAQTKDPDALPQNLAQWSGKTLTAVDGAALSLTPIEGGIQRDITGAGGSPQKTTFTFINDRLGTVAADGKDGAANVTGFFRLTDTGVDVRYADGGSEILSATGDGGVLLRRESPGAAPVCRSFYPDGHAFSQAEKKTAVAEYATRLGLQPVDTVSGCPDAPAAAMATAPEKPRPEHHAEAVIRHPARFVAAARTPKDTLGALAPVTVRESVVHPVDAMPMPTDGTENSANNERTPQ